MLFGRRANNQIPPSTEYWRRSVSHVDLLQSFFAREEICTTLGLLRPF